MEQEMKYGNDYKFIPATSVASGKGVEVLPDLYMYTTQIANICLVGEPNSNDFVLVDAGVPKQADKIIAEVEERFGKENKPKAIILTHGHFDHVGSIIELIEKWEVPVYAHELEMPYLTGAMNYPHPDASSDPGLVAKMSPMFPNDAINLGNHVQALPTDGSVPFLPEFRWIHTPGHTRGHVSFFRDKDRALIAGDAFITVKQESLTSVISQKEEISGPPKYLTQDFDEALKSIKKLIQLKPEVAITGHGVAMSGQELRDGLDHLVHHYAEYAKPNQ